MVFKKHLGDPIAFQSLQFKHNELRRAGSGWAPRRWRPGPGGPAEQLIPVPRSNDKKSAFERAESRVRPALVQPSLDPVRDSPPAAESLCTRCLMQAMEVLHECDEDRDGTDGAEEDLGGDLHAAVRAAAAAAPAAVASAAAEARRIVVAVVVMVMTVRVVVGGAFAVVVLVVDGATLEAIGHDFIPILSPFQVSYIKIL
ncbi:oxidoreductase ptaK [Frankliniella fusca]|uniref:Oxidoreductase ptaK n=1 Tax=Frankliniella fusca TaxID=407009 RepID=A0AAE1HUZ2_9NEOP|nr:oxidoreductase ptaK [Frankliniella fusca]